MQSSGRTLSRSHSRNKLNSTSTLSLSNVDHNLTTIRKQSNSSLPNLFQEKSVIQSLFGNNSGLQIGTCSQQGRRPYQEDEFCVRLFLPPSSNVDHVSDPRDFLKTHFIGLFDGHAGGRCSKEISATFPDFLADDPEYLSNLPRALHRTFNTANAHFMKIADKLKIHDGSTGICAVIRNNKLIVANVGDCRALLITSGFPVQMSIDQKPTNPEELKRIASFGGTVEICNGVARVNRVLAVARAFGNRTLRSVIRPDAELMQRELTSDDEYLVMASDGLWDVLSNKEVFDICRYHRNECNSQVIAEDLVSTALRKGSMDNVTCLVVKLSLYIQQMENTGKQILDRIKSEIDWTNHGSESTDTTEGSDFSDNLEWTKYVSTDYKTKPNKLVARPQSSFQLPSTDSKIFKKPNQSSQLTVPILPKANALSQSSNLKYEQFLSSLEQKKEFYNTVGNSNGYAMRRPYTSQSKLDGNSDDDDYDDNDNFTIARNNKK